MKWEMEVVSPAPYVVGTNKWAAEEESSNKSAKWTPAENKMFENALAVYDKDTPDRWLKIADMIPGKTVDDVMRQYKELEVDVGKIEAGLIPIPGYNTTSPFTLDWVNSHHSYDGFKQSYGLGGKRTSSGRTPDQERKKGIPWTEEEHKLFLMGLKKYGKGDWRNISRNFVVTRTPTQVASHAQKYFIRQLSGGKDKRRASIHDITTVNLNDPPTPSPDIKTTSSPDPIMLSHHQHSNAGSSTTPTHFQWNQGINGSNLGFHSSTNGNMFAPSNSFGINSFGTQIEGHNYIGPPQSIGFGMDSSTQHYPHART